MAAPGNKYFIHDHLQIPFPHHTSFKALWETKWRKPCELGVYPFMYGSIVDFQPVVDDLIKNDLKEPYDWDAYAETFFPKAEQLTAKAVKAEQEGEFDKASELYLRSSALYRIARFPAPRSAKQQLAWERGKVVSLKGLSLRRHPIEELDIHHAHAGPRDGGSLKFYYHLPQHATAKNTVPLIIIMTGLDGYRTELSVWMEGWRQVGCASLVIEIPGTGDSPADPSDPTSPDRQWSTLFDWVNQQDCIDQNKVLVWGFSTGAYYAIRCAHTHPSKAAGFVALGGGVHHMFDPEWLQASNHLEYPFDLGRTLGHKFGYGNDFERFKLEATTKFSLMNDGTLDKIECGRLLLVNGTEDSIFPIDDYYLALQRGGPKEVRLVAQAPHMGEPTSFSIVVKWIYKLLDINADPRDQLRTLPTKALFI